MYRLDRRRRTQIVKCLVEGTTLRGTSRATGAARMTIGKLISDLGFLSARFQHDQLRNLQCQCIECDEIWSFIYAKDGNVGRARNAPPNAGDVWLWVAMDAETKLVVTWFVGRRTQEDCDTFMRDLHSRLAGRPQITTDGLGFYLTAVGDAFGPDVDFAQLVKTYGRGTEADQRDRQARYSPRRCTGSAARRVIGSPALNRISTSLVERQNLTLRTDMRRYMRLTLAFSKSIEMHTHAVALHYFNYNFVRIHSSLGVTPAMAAGVTDRLWEIEDLVDMLIEEERVRDEERASGPAHRYLKTRQREPTARQAALATC